MQELNPDDPRWQLTQQVVQSPQFEKSQRLRSFLLFVCERELSGQRDAINEHEIGVHVFGRAPGYNPGDDSIVRSQARILRQRLTEYFAGPGHDAPLHITIPKGSYVPVFEPSSPPVQPPAEAVEGRPLVAEPEVASSRWRQLIFLLTPIVLALGLALGILMSGHRPERAELARPVARFWQTIFSSPRTAVLVPADSTLVLIEELTGTQVSFDSYQSRKYLQSAALNHDSGALIAAQLEQSHYTSMADLNVVTRLLDVPRSSSSHAEVRYARDLSLSDARENNLILIGGARANPWFQLFASRMNFLVDYDWQQKKNCIINKAPQAGEVSEYTDDSGTDRRDYGVIAYKPSLDEEGEALLIAGTSSAGTQAAGDFLLSAPLFADFLRSIQRSDGSIPHFELLLAARDLNGSVAGSTILASRVDR